MEQSPPSFNASGFTPPTVRTTDNAAPAPAWQDLRSQTGISGLFFPSVNEMYVDPRNRVHHNDQIRMLLEWRFDANDPEMDPVMAWANGIRASWADDQPDDAVASDVELPRSAGGMTQVYHRLDLDTVMLQHGLDVSPAALWPVVYTCRLLDVSEISTVRFTHATPRLATFDGIEASHEGSKRQLDGGVDRRFPLKDAYAEMRFEGALPEPLLDREWPPIDPQGFDG